jgi:hypothetical protein
MMILMTREFVYMPTFEKLWKEANLTEDDLRDLEIYLCEHPDAGKMIKGTGGLRKLRWSRPGKGKSGGVRTLYVDFADFEQIHFISCFKKSQKESLTTSEKKSIKSSITNIKDNLRERRSQNER